MIDEQQVQRWMALVPEPLAVAAALSLCEQDIPCDDCVDSTKAVLSLVYAYNPYANPSQPCMACRFVRANPNDLHEACLFHEGMDQGMLKGFHPVTPVRVTTKPPHQHWWSSFPILTPRQHLIMSAIISALWVAMVIYVAARS